MECPICLEHIVGDSESTYTLKGCSHKTCVACAAMMANQPENQVHPFGKNVELNEVFVCLKCPMCRQMEPNPLTPIILSDLIQKYPLGYRIWFETELFADYDGTWYYSSRRKNNVVLFPTYDCDTYSLLDRIEFCSRTTSCWLDDMNLYSDPDIFLQWYPIQHTYTHPYQHSIPLRT